MRSRNMRCVFSRSAISSAVIFGSFFFPILFLQQATYPSDVCLNLPQESHDSCDISVRNERLDRAIVVVITALRKWPFWARVWPWV
jgi:hypothetical protein